MVKMMKMKMMMMMMVMMARSWHTAQFGRCELVGGGEAWHALQHDDDHDDAEEVDDDADEDGTYGFHKGEDDNGQDFDNDDNDVS